MTPPLSPEIEESFNKLHLAIELAMKQNRVLRRALKLACQYRQNSSEWPAYWIAKAQEIIDKEEGK